MSQTSGPTPIGGHAAEADHLRPLPPARPVPRVAPAGVAPAALPPAAPGASATVALAGPAGDRAVVLAYSRYTVDPETNLVALAIVDAATDEIIRQVPPEEIIELARIMQRQAERLGRPTPVPLLAQAGGGVVDRRA